MTQPPKLTDAQIESCARLCMSHRALARAIEAARDKMWAEMLAGQEPVGWEWRWFDESPDTVTSQKWSEWKRVEPRSALQTLDDAVAEFESYIASGYRYEIRALYTAPQPAKPIEIDWSQAGSLMDAAASAKHAGCMTGTTNWAAHVYRYMVQAKPAKRVPLTEEEIAAIVRYVSRGSAMRPMGKEPTSVRIARAIEAAHGIKGETE